MSHAPHPLPEHCPNCAAPVHGPFCAQCGQETHNALPTLHEFLHEYLHHYVALEGKLLHTLRLLLLPGQLTLEFLAGRRKRYVRPLPLYVTISFVFFLVLGLTQSHHRTGTPDLVQVSTQNSDAATHAANIDEAAHELENDPDAANSPTAQRLLRWGGHILEQFSQPGRAAQWEEQLLHRLPYAVFALMPLFAGMCALVLRKRHLPYGLHLLFTLHWHAFIFLVFLLCLIPGVDRLSSWIPTAVLVYLVVALKRVYGGRWWPQICRAVLLGIVYAIFVGLAIGAVALLTAQWSLDT